MSKSTLNFRIDTVTRDQVERIAKDERRSLSQMVGILLEEAVKTRGRADVSGAIQDVNVDSSV